MPNDTLEPVSRNKENNTRAKEERGKIWEGSTHFNTDGTTFELYVRTSAWDGVNNMPEVVEVPVGRGQWGERGMETVSGDEK